MPAPESTGPSSVPISGSSSRKEKKKQAKEERDRLKQAEKKKRRLEKALATAAAIRIELEKKKQKRKEEEQRLDEEGAALAEAVALQVLVEEDVDLLEESLDTDNEAFEERDESGSHSSVVKVEEAGKSLQNASRSPSQSVEGKQQVSCTYVSSVESKVDTAGKDLYSGDVLLLNCAFGDLKRDKLGKIQDVKQVFNNPEDHLKYSNERAKAAEIAAGMAAAQAVAALRIAEEARAEAEAAKKAAEIAISQVLDRKQLSHFDKAALQVKFQSQNVEMERDELKARLEETERQLREKTRQVINLEQNLEGMTQYLLQLKGKLPRVLGVAETQGETSERNSTNRTESAGGTVDQ